MGTPSTSKRHGQPCNDKFLHLPFTLIHLFRSPRIRMRLRSFPAAKRPQNAPTNRVAHSRPAGSDSSFSNSLPQTYIRPPPENALWQGKPSLDLATFSRVISETNSSGETAFGAIMHKDESLPCTYRYFPLVMRHVCVNVPRNRVRCWKVHTSRGFLSLIG